MRIYINFVFLIISMLQLDDIIKIDITRTPSGFIAALLVIQCFKQCMELQSYGNCAFKYKEVFSQKSSAIKRIEFTMSRLALQIMFLKQALDTYFHIYAYIQIWKALFENTTYDLRMGIGSHLILEWDSSRFGKDTYMKSASPKSVKCHSKNKWVSNVNPKFVDCVLEKSSSCMYTCIYVYIFMKSSSLKHDRYTWHWHWKPIFSNGACRVLENSSSYINKYTGSIHKSYMVWLVLDMLIMAAREHCT